METHWFNNINEIKEAARDGVSPYWFSESAMKFFHCRIFPRVYAGRYFVTSERDDYAQEPITMYSVREAKYTGAIITVGDFCGYRTLSQAKEAIKKLTGDSNE